MLPPATRETQVQSFLFASFLGAAEEHVKFSATAEVLRVINSSPGDLAPVFDAMLDMALHLGQAAFGTLWTYDGEYMHASAIRGAPPQYAEFLRRGPHRPSPVVQRLLSG